MVTELQHVVAAPSLHACMQVVINRVKKIKVSNPHDKLVEFLAVSDIVEVAEPNEMDEGTGDGKTPEEPHDLDDEDNTKVAVSTAVYQSDNDEEEEQDYEEEG